jgi:hypothetical protein
LRLEAFARLGWTVARHSVGKGNGVHRTGAGAADPRDGKPIVFEQLVEDPPGKGAMRAAALQGEFDRLFGPPVHAKISEFKGGASTFPKIHSIEAEGRPAERSQWSMNVRCAGGDASLTGTVPDVRLSPSMPPQYVKLQNRGNDRRTAQLRSHNATTIVRAAVCLRRGSNLIDKLQPIGADHD